MADIVERLRDSDTTRRIGESYADVHDRRQADRNEAADEITRLRAEVASLTIDLQHAYGEVNFQIDKVTIHGEAIARLTDEVEKLNEAMEMLLTDVRRTDLDMRDLKTENEKLRAALDEAQREITQLYEDAAGESI